MLNVKTPEQVLAIINEEFKLVDGREELLPLSGALGRTLARDIKAGEYVPDFDRSTVDGYALMAKDSFGCCEAIPALLKKSGRVLMGQEPESPIEEGCCCAVPTGGALPEGADSVVMIEYTEDYGDGCIGVFKPAAPGQNVIFRGDDVYPGKPLLSKGRVLAARDIGALAAIGVTEVPVVKRLKVGIISTGDELVSPEQKPLPGQVRDVNGPMLKALIHIFGGEPLYYGIIKDREDRLRLGLEKALKQCDMVLLSGGSSVGEKDAAAKIIGEAGEILFHGIAIKPGKPTILGKKGNIPIVGLPGHPVAAYFITRLFVLPIMDRLTGRKSDRVSVSARLTENVSANHGRAQCQGVRLTRENGELLAQPVRTKSGLITGLAGTEGYFLIDRDCEGLPQGAEIEVIMGE